MAATRLQLSIGLALTVLVCVTLAEPVERHSHASGAGEKIHGKAHQQQHASVPDREDDIDLDPFVDTSKVSDDEVVEDPAATEEPKEEEAPVNPLPQNGTYVPSNCTSCRFRIREELRQLNLESIKEEILNKLGMRNAPNMTGRELPKIPPLHNLLDKYGMQNDAPKQTFQLGTVFLDEDDDFHARTEKVLAFAQPPPHLRHVQQGQNIQYFKFSEKITRNRVLDSQLWLYLKDEEKTEKVITIEVLQVMKIKEGESLTMTSVLSAKRALRQGWITLDVRKLMAHWFKYPKENLGIVVRTEDEADKKYVVTYPSEEEFFIPFVQVHMADGRKHRTKRTIGINCNENSHETRCCRYPLTVDFETFGWDWIIAPKKYEANYCSGECPYVFLQKYPHTHIVQQANPAGTAGPCCAPRKMSHISMLYFDNEFNIIYGLLPGMVVDRCGCS